MSRKNGFTQWGWMEVEELLQCPVCLDKPTAGTMVEQCRNGHHVCASCRTQVTICPMCKSNFIGTRNFVVEELINHYEILKNIMLLSNITEESKVKKKKKKSKKFPHITVELPPRRKFETPNPNKGVYPCRADGCDVKLCVSRLLNHTRSYHSDMLLESEIDENETFSHFYEVPVIKKTAINTKSFILSVRGIGLVYLTLQILRTGHLIAFLQMAAQLKNAEDVVATLEFFSPRNIHQIYKQRLVSVRDTIEGMMQRKKCFVLDRNQFKSICVDKKFKFTISLSRYTLVNHSCLSIALERQIHMAAAIRASLIDELEDNKQLTENETNYCNGTKPKTNSFLVNKKHMNGGTVPVANIGYLKVVPSSSTMDSSSSTTVISNIANSANSNTAGSTNSVAGTDNNVSNAPNNSANKKKRHKKRNKKNF